MPPFYQKGGGGAVHSQGGAQLGPRGPPRGFRGQGNPGKAPKRRVDLPPLGAGPAATPFRPRNHPVPSSRATPFRGSRPPFAPGLAHPFSRRRGNGGLREGWGRPGRCPRPHGPCRLGGWARGGGGARGPPPRGQASVTRRVPPANSPATRRRRQSRKRA